MPSHAEKMVNGLRDPMITSAAGAIFDVTGAYRYLLWRRWEEVEPAVTFVMLNPSSAGADRVDPTIRRCIGFARRWGCRGITVVNLCAYRTSDPAQLRRCADPVGLDNERFLRLAVEGAPLVVAGWGNRGVSEGANGVMERAPAAEYQCLGLTRQGEPRHPLYLPVTTQLEPFAGAKP